MKTTGETMVRLGFISAFETHASVVNPLLQLEARYALLNVLDRVKVSKLVAIAALLLKRTTSARFR